MKRQVVVREDAADEGPVYQITVPAMEDVQDLAAGIVPRSIRTQALTLCDFDDRIRRNAEKPARGRKPAAPSPDRSE